MYIRRRNHTAPVGAGEHSEVGKSSVLQPSLMFADRIGLSTIIDVQEHEVLGHHLFGFQSGILQHTAQYAHRPARFDHLSDVDHRVAGIIMWQNLENSPKHRHVSGRRWRTRQNIVSHDRDTIG